MKKPYIEYPTWMARQRLLGLKERAVYQTLLDHRDPKTELCWPGIDKIAEEADLSPRAVERSLKVLVELGMIERRRRMGTSNLYLVHRYPEPDQKLIAQKAHIEAATQAGRSCPTGRSVLPDRPTKKLQQLSTSSTSTSSSTPFDRTAVREDMPASEKQTDLINVAIDRWYLDDHETVQLLEEARDKPGLTMREAQNVLAIATEVRKREAAYHREMFGE